MIGILDSGVGGLAVARLLTDFIDDCGIIFFADTETGPYGNKSMAMVESHALKGCRFLLEKKVRLLVIACQDISSINTTPMAENFPVKIIDAVSSSVEEALKVSRFSRFGVIGTRVTIDSDVYDKKIKKFKPQAKVYSNPSPLLVAIAEEGWFKKPETHMVVKKYIQPLKVRQIDTLIAANSYFFSLNQVLRRKAGKRIKVVDSSLALAGYVVSYLKTHPEMHQKLPRNNYLRFYVSDWTPHIQKTAKRIFGKNLQLEKVNLSSF